MKSRFAAPRSLRSPFAPRHASAAGFSLPEVLVASAVFMFVMLAAYQAFQRSQESYKLGQNQAEMVQSARVAFEQMTGDIRLAGFEFDLDGERERYPNAPDEPIEFMHRRAVVVRANFDFEDKEFKGREPGLELQTEGQSVATECCPIVTTANDEIVGFFLGKPVGPQYTQPTGSITAKFDVTGTPADIDDGVGRDAFILDGVIAGEETVTVPPASEPYGVELLNPGDAGYAPPYTLYKFVVNDNASTVTRIPLIDNVYSLEMTYYDDAGAVVLGPSTPAGTNVQANWGDDAGRALRWSVRRVLIQVQTMTPDRDLRLARATGVPNYQGKRLFTLQADILPPNLGRRGSRDRDINPPEPVRNVEICTDQCRMVRVSWDPGPPEDRVADYVITLCTDAPCEDADDQSNWLATFIVPASYDVIESQEFAVFTWEDSPLIQNGQTLFARVVARNAAGTESECPEPGDPACPDCCNSDVGAVVGESSRPDTFERAFGSGYDPADTDFPDAWTDNSSSGMQIVTDPLSSNFPPAAQVRITLDTPRYALNDDPGAGSPPWTTKELGGPVVASSACHREESTPADANNDYRTPFNAFWRDSTRGNTYVWRASASDQTSWGGAPNVRSFAPKPSNLVDFTYLELKGGTTTLTQASGYDFAETAHGDRYDGVSTAEVEPLGYPRPVQAVTPCEIYYYRFRAISLCWSDREEYPDAGDMPDGLNDDMDIKAWSVSTDPELGASVYRQRAMAITPFYPPMLNAGDTPGLRDKPDPNVHDSDAYSSPGALDTYAIPAYSLPQRVVDVSGNVTDWIKPEAPNELYLTRVGPNGSVMQGAGNASLFDSRLIFNAARRTAPEAGQGDPIPAAYRTYRLYRKAATSATPGPNEFNFETANPTMIAEFDTLGPNDVRYYTMQDATPSGSPLDLLPDIGALNDLASGWASGDPSACSQDPEEDTHPGTSACVPYIYWLKTAQCTKFDDGVDIGSADLSDASPAFLFPCSLTYDVVDIAVNPTTSANAPVQVTAQASVYNDAGTPVCGARIKSARLLAYRNTGDKSYIGASDWVAYPGADETCEPVTFATDQVSQAVRGASNQDGFRFVVEVSSGVPGQATRSCRLRSDYGPVEPDTVRGIPTACASQRVCGTQAAPAIFGTIDEDDVTLTDGDTAMLVNIPILFNACGASTRVDLRQLEFKLAKGGGSGDVAIPDFVSAELLAGVQVPGPLPSILGSDPCDVVLASGDQDAGEDDASEADLNGTDGTMVLRWRDAFCIKDDPTNAVDPCPCTFSYPVVRATASEPNLVVKLTFEGSLCDVRLTEFNFRVPLLDPADTDLDGVTAEELVCTQRPRRAEDGTAPGTIDSTICPDATLPAGGPAGADPDLPAGCTLEGEGRGPALIEEIACGSCTENCAPCQCPLNDTDGDIAQDVNPASLLQDDITNDFGNRSTLLELEWDQATLDGCSGISPPDPPCKFRIAEIELEIACGADGRDCAGLEPLGKLGDVEPDDADDPPDAVLIRQDTSEVILPPPSTILENDPSLHRYVWTGLNIDIENGHTFVLRTRWDDSINGSEVRVAKIRFSRPFAGECNSAGAVGGVLGPTCTAPSAIVLPYN